MSILLGVRGKGANHPKVILRTKGLAERDKGYYQVLERVASKEYKLGFCQLQKDKVRGKMYLLMSYTFESSVAASSVPARVMGVDLGVATPAYCAFNDSVKRLSLFMEGDKLLRVKMQIQYRRRSIARETTKWNSRKGHGLSGKSYPIRAISQKWVNFRRTWNHTLSSRIVDYALREHASTIHIEDLFVNGIPRFLGKDWPVAELLQMITYKGEEAGLKVEKVNPYKTSQTCSRCGVIKDNFTFKDRIKNGMPIFACDACGFQDNADYNAAKNIAKSTLITK
jgi:IS605 OrfB family transposase